jgi:hypothetical protein
MAPTVVTIGDGNEARLVLAIIVGVQQNTKTHRPDFVQESKKKEPNGLKGVAR